ncbi:MAG: hypothetical protein QW416_04710 [Candidatus Nitrosocaldaceae archaeon]
MSFNYTFMYSCKNTVHEVAPSPKMMGMDVPKEAQTRIKSGDMMKSSEIDPNFFGTRSHEYVINIESPRGIKIISSDMDKMVELSLQSLMS